MPSLLSRFSRAWLSRPKTTVLVWLFVSLSLGVTGLLLGTKTVIPGPTNIDTLLANPGERTAIEAGLPPRDMLLVILHHAKLTVDSEEFIETRESLADKLVYLKYTDSQQQVFKRVQTAGRTMLGDENFLSETKHSILFKAETEHPIYRSSEALRMLPNALEEWNAEFPEFSLSYLSDGTINNEMFDLINNDLDTSLIYTLPITFLILLWAFGSLVAAAIPLLIATMSLIGSLGISALLSHLLGPVSATASQLVVLLVLAIGIDYSLFIISRIREEVSRGASYRKATVQARSTTGLAVLWSGVIVALSLCGLFLMKDTVLASMALVSIIAVLFTVMGAVLVLPGVLLLLGERIEYGQIPLRWKSSGEKPRFSSWIEISIKRPVITLTCSVALLLGLAYFTTQIELGSTVEPHLMPRSMQSHDAFLTLEREFPDLAGVDFSVVLRAENLDELEELGELQPFFDRVNERDTVRGPFKTEWNEARTIVRYHFFALGSGNDIENRDLVHNVREHIIPETLTPLGVAGSLGGTLPYVIDDIDRYLARTPLVFGAVLGLSLLFLLIAFRSLVVPLKAMMLNILSTLAAFGMLVLFFQFGVVEAWNYEVIESFVPPLLFSILFGLSMDYHVFLLSRVYEESCNGHALEVALQNGIQRTFRTITSAALIMVSVFAIIASLELPIMKELGLGLAVAVFLDATIIRCLLLPASMILLGKWNWYLPKSLEWLPRVRLDEG